MIMFYCQIDIYCLVFILYFCLVLLKFITGRKIPFIIKINVKIKIFQKFLLECYAEK